jgi:hypothetical protein
MKKRIAKIATITTTTNSTTVFSVMEILLQSDFTSHSPAGKSDASQEPVFVSGDDGEILGIAVGTLREGNINDCSILPEM